MTNSAWKTPHFFACYAKRSAETGKCSPTFVWLLPGIFDLLSVSVFRKNNILDSSKKRGERDRSEVYIKYRRKLIATWNLQNVPHSKWYFSPRDIVPEQYQRSAIKSSIKSFSPSLSGPLTHLLSASGNYRNGDNHTSETLRHNSRGQEGKERGWMEKRLYTSSYTRLPIGRIVPCPGYSRWWWVEVPIAVELLAND